MDWKTDSDDSSDEDILEEVLFYSIFAVSGALNVKQSQSQNTGLTGQAYTDELFNSGHKQLIYNVIRMTLPSFYELRYRPPH